MDFGLFFNPCCRHRHIRWHTTEFVIRFIMFLSLCLSCSVCACMRYAKPDRETTPVPQDELKINIFYGRWILGDIFDWRKLSARERAAVDQAEWKIGRNREQFKINLFSFFVWMQSANALHTGRHSPSTQPPSNNIDRKGQKNERFLSHSPRTYERRLDERLRIEHRRWARREKSGKEI